MIYIKDIKDGDSFRETYLVKSSTKNVTNNGRTYLNVTLQDKTGFIQGKKWEADSEDIEIFKPGNFVTVSYEAYYFKDKLELKLYDANKVEVMHKEEFIPCSPIGKDVLQKQLEQYLSLIKDKNIKNIIDTIYNTYKDKILTYPAASNNHHAFYSGLLYHTVSMLNVASFLSTHYSNIDKDILLAGVFLHDVGKIKELSDLNYAIEYTFEGRLIGHIIIAVNLINNIATNLKIENEEKVILLEHAVLASHGKYEFGSPVLGATKEAILLNFIDDLDAKMMMYDNNIKELQPGEFSKCLLNFDNRRLYKKQNSLIKDKENKEEK